VTTVAAVAAAYGVAVEAIEDRAFPDHERCGRYVVRPHILSAVGERLSEGMSLDEAEAILAEYDLSETSAVVSMLGYRVVWDGLSGGTLESR